MLTCIFHSPREYLANNVSVTVYPVNEPWLYSTLWCSGVHSVSSDAPQVLRKVPYPIWLMVSSSPSLIWHYTHTHTYAFKQKRSDSVMRGQQERGQRLTRAQQDLGGRKISGSSAPNFSSAWRWRTSGSCERGQDRSRQEQGCPAAFCPNQCHLLVLGDMDICTDLLWKQCKTTLFFFIILAES